MDSKKTYAERIADMIGVHNGEGRKTLTSELLERTQKELLRLTRLTKDYAEDLKNSEHAKVANRMIEILRNPRLRNNGIVTAIEVECYRGKENHHIETEQHPTYNHEQDFNGPHPIEEFDGPANPNY